MFFSSVPAFVYTWFIHSASPRRSSNQTIDITFIRVKRKKTFSSYVNIRNNCFMNQVWAQQQQQKRGKQNTTSQCRMNEWDRSRTTHRQQKIIIITISRRYMRRQIPDTVMIWIECGNAECGWRILFMFLEKFICGRLDGCHFHWIHRQTALPSIIPHTHTTTTFLYFFSTTRLLSLSLSIQKGSLLRFIFPLALSRIMTSACIMHRGSSCWSTSCIIIRWHLCIRFNESSHLYLLVFDDKLELREREWDLERWGEGIIRDSWWAKQIDANLEIVDCWISCVYFVVLFRCGAFVTYVSEFYFIHNLKWYTSIGSISDEWRRMINHTVTFRFYYIVRQFPRLSISFRSSSALSHPFYVFLFCSSFLAFLLQHRYL